MNKQELEAKRREIRELITEEAHDYFTFPSDVFAGRLIKRLSSLDVCIIDSDAELSDNEVWHKSEREFEAYCAGKNDMLEEGYVKVYPLEEKK